MFQLILLALPLISASPASYSYHAQRIGLHPGFEIELSQGRGQKSIMPNFYRSGPFPVYRRTFIPVSRTLEPAPAPKLAEPLKKALTSYISATGVVGECGELIEAYLQSILSGSSAPDAAQSAADLYLKNWRSFRSLSPACQAAGQAYRAAYYAGKEPILPAAQAYLEASGKSGDPCSAAARTYLEAFTAGKEDGALLAAARAFSSQFAQQPSLDPACTKAALAVVGESSSPNSVALQAFVKKAEELGGSSAYDPVCAGAAESFIQSYMSGAEDERSGMQAARTFLSLYLNNPRATQDSPCAAATKAYVEALPSQSKDSPTGAALTAFISDAAETNSLGLDPVCAAAAQAYLGSLLSGQSQELADEAAAVAYLEAVEENPDNKESESVCSRAAEAYIANFSK